MSARTHSEQPSSRANRRRVQRRAARRKSIRNPLPTWGGFAIVMTLIIMSSFLLDALAVETGTIKGKITDIQSKAALGFANVVVVGTTVGAMSLEDGGFEIRGVPPGKHVVKAMMMGYRTAEKTVTVVAGEEVEVNFALAVTIVSEVQAIEVTAERKMVDVTSSDTRRGVTSEQVLDSAVDNSVEAIALRTGIVKTGDELHARGGRSGEIRMQIDGVPVDDPLASSRKPYKSKFQGRAVAPKPGQIRVPADVRCQIEPWNTEAYDPIDENDFLAAIENPFSTFSIDVDAASYSNVRRYVEHASMPPRDAVRIEELINYFDYDYQDPGGNAPFSITAEVAECPWNAKNKLVHVGLQGKRLGGEDLPPGNLVFLIDVSGSMRPPNKLPLLKQAFRLLAQGLRDEDRVAIVVYAGQSGVLLPSTSGGDKETVINAIMGLHGGGSTNGAGGIRKAYEIAAENFIEGGNNRVILATDGDFNVGVSSDGELVELIEEKRKTGVFLTVLGFGVGNLKDAKMEKLADKGNGHYAYIDNIGEAQKVLVNEIGATLLTIAKDVKIQLEFNPVRVESYRLIGYENRMLKKRDFEDDKKDAGELGAGHSVTALYEIVPASGETTQQASRYVNVSVTSEAEATRDLLTVRLRYKLPDEDESKLLTERVRDVDRSFKRASRDFRFAAAVAEFGMLLRDSDDKSGASYDHVIKTAKKARGEDRYGYRAGFIDLVNSVKLLDG